MITAGRPPGWTDAATAEPPEPTHSLRANLLESLAQLPEVPEVAPVATATVPVQTSTLTPEEVLDSAPAVVRLCVRYEAELRNLVGRGRRQRLGVALVVTTLQIVVVWLAEGDRLPVSSAGLVAIAAGSVAALTILMMAALWRRDLHRLHRQQGDRLVRALHVSDTPSALRVDLAHDHARAARVFLACYRAWHERTHPLHAATRWGRG